MFRTNTIRTVSDLLKPEPEVYGLRGDMGFWQDLKSVLSTDMTPEEAEQAIRDHFETKTGKPLAEDTIGYVQEYDHGGMSKGHVSGRWVLTVCIPTIQKRLKNMQEG